MVEDPTGYFSRKKDIIDIIHHECCGNKLQGTYKGYKTIKKKILKVFLKKIKKKH